MQFVKTEDILIHYTARVLVSSKETYTKVTRIDTPAQNRGIVGISVASKART